MFTGLVEGVGTVVSMIRRPPGVLLEIRHAVVADDCAIGASIAVNGCCLTVVAREESCLSFEAGSETLSRTNLGKLQPGDSVNLERSLRVGERMGGHFVTGHVDCVGHLQARTDEGDWATCWFSLPRPWSRHVVSKGSITVDGVSLTVVAAEADRFSVALIPHTLEATTLGRLRIGDPVNLETDILAKYVDAAVSHQLSPQTTEATLQSGSGDGP